jgi:alpha-glucosidase
MRKLITLLAIYLVCIASAKASFPVFVKDSLFIASPDGKISVRINNATKLQYSVYFNDQLIVSNATIDLIVTGKESLSEASKSIHSIKRKAVNSIIEVPVSERRKKIKDYYNELTIQFKAPYAIKFRVFNNGVAYQIESKFKDSIFIEKEIANFNFPNATKGWLPLIHKREDSDIFHTSYEEQYPLSILDSLNENNLAYNPVLLAPTNGPKIAITESDLLDYPGMFLQGTSSNGLKGIFAPYPAEEKTTNELYPETLVTKRENYIAYVNGSRYYPWRILMIAPEDKDLPNNDLVYQLASPNKVGDVSWVQTGKATDEWIINLNLFNIPFKPGINTASYKYYIDFANRFGFERIMMDAGWSDTKDLFKIIPGISMDTLTAYAKEKGIKISMWTAAVTLNKQLDSALDQFNKWGIDFIMTDFIDRDDQKTVQFYERIAKACAAHKIMIMYHGAYAPKGFNRTYPNAITREGVLGSEYNIWSDKVTPAHDLIIPFTRMLAGSFDYEPGFLNNANKASFRNVEGAPISFGTRCHQLAMFVVYDNPMQIFSGNPSQGYQEIPFMELLGSIPTGWEDTKILEAKVSKYITTARQKGNDWYIAGMNDWDAKDQAISFDFLAEGDYTATICEDGLNADKYAADYKITSSTLNNKSILNLHSAPGGGFLIRLIKQK